MADRCNNQGVCHHVFSFSKSLEHGDICFLLTPCELIIQNQAFATLQDKVVWLVVKEEIICILKYHSGIHGRSETDLLLLGVKEVV